MPMAEATDGGASRRPLSPHLKIYTPLINMVMSILHRLTGAALYFGTIILAWWLISAASGPAYFNYVSGLLWSPLGMLVLLGYTWALVHHMAGGLRHLVWDTGRGFKLSTVNAMCWASIVASVALTVIIWAIGLKLRGVL
jgi:succinate dehydrogenase / fumarate reductase, cytochrome b subunit